MVDKGQESWLFSTILVFLLPHYAILIMRFLEPETCCSHLEHDDQPLVARESVAVAGGIGLRVRAPTWQHEEVTQPSPNAIRTWRDPYLRAQWLIRPERGP